MAAAIVNQVISNIIDTEPITDLLNELQICKLDEKNFFALQAFFISYACKYNNLEAITEIVEIAEQRLPSMPAIGYVFCNELLSDEMLNIIVYQCYPEKSVLDYYLDVINLPNNQKSIEVAKRMHKILPNLSKDDWNLLYSLTDNVDEERYPNQELRKFFSKQLYVADYIIPPWIKNLTAPVFLPVIPNIPTVERAAELLMNDMKKIGISIENEKPMKDALMEQYALSSISERIEMLKHIVPLEPFDDTTIFQEFGPVNTTYCNHSENERCSHYLDVPCEECVKYGGCRMLLCKEITDKYSDDIDEHVQDNDWFEGKCQRCKIKIPKRQYAIRQPLMTGSWLGCYCSEACLRAAAPNNRRIDRIMEQLNSIGIRDL